ncbi:MAG TPA: alpha/beta fold hydrolase [Noviherbaspirillum sp.]|nr:alpha/beta fold hydrolase [Noviherbaspirillum sp.]
MRSILTFMAAGAATIAIVIALLYFWQSNLILLPGISGGGSDVLAQCAPGSAEWLEDGKYRGKICEPRGMVRGTVIIYHGNAGTVDDRAALAAALTERGFRVVLVEYPGYGKRAGHATIRKVLAASLDDFVLARAKWNGSLYVLGESFGAGVAAEVIRTHGDHAAGVVLITPWDSLANVVNTMFAVPLAFLLQERFDSAESLSRYRRKIVIVAAERDEVLPVGHARALAKAVPAADYLELRSAGHNDWPLFMTSKEWDWMVESLVKPPSQ